MAATNASSAMEWHVKEATQKADAQRMWAGGEDDLTAAEAAELAGAKATIERLRKVQHLRAQVRRTAAEHERALAALAESAIEEGSQR